MGERANTQPYSSLRTRPPIGKPIEEILGLYRRLIGRRSVRTGACAAAGAVKADRWQAKKRPARADHGQGRTILPVAGQKGARS